MQVFTIGERLPEAYEKQVFLKDNGIDFAIAVTEQPMFIFMILSNISQDEKDIMQNEKVSVGATVIEGIPFLAIDYGDGLHFDMPIFTLGEGFCLQDNALNVVAVERNTYCVQSMRVLGLNESIMNIIINGVNNMSFDIDDAKVVADSVYNTHNIDGIFKKCELQEFTN